MPIVKVFESFAVLVVGDGIISFASSDPTEATFTLHHFVQTLRAHPFPKITVTTAHRRGDPSADIQTPFDFSAADLSTFDEIWLFGYEGSNIGFVASMTSPITDDEVVAIATFMENGGGVFATGDHSGLGSFMAGRIPRVRSMRRWFDSDGSGANAPPPGYPPNWPPFGSTRIDTTRPDHAHQFFFDNQSDDIPQPLKLPGGMAHPILQGPNGPITRFPDHMHEGEVVVPWTTGDTLTFNGKSFVEYPTVNGHFEQPAIIAWGTVLGGHATPLEGSDSQQFFGNDDPADPKTFGVLCTYDGRTVNRGRVVTDSSFHHYIDLNLTGDKLGVGYKQHGFDTPKGKQVLTDLNAFYVNTAIWLARSLHFSVILEYVLILPWWWELFDPGGPVEDDPLQILRYGDLVRQDATRYVNDGILVGWVNETLRPQGLAVEVAPAASGTNGDRQSAVVARHAGRIIAAVLGGTALEIMRTRGTSPAVRLSVDDARRAAERGSTIGLRALAGLMRTEAQESERLAEQLAAFAAG